MSLTTLPPARPQPDRSGEANRSASPLPRTVTADRLADVPHLAALVDRLGGIPLERIHLHPWPGTATEADVVDWNEQAMSVPCELIDGTLVEKAPMAMVESRFATILLAELVAYERSRKTIVCYDASAMNRMAGGNVRMPDLSIYLRSRLAEVYPDGKITRHPKVSDLVPDLFVEVLSESNTAAEIDRKQAEFFEMGSRELWVVEPVRRTVEVRRPGADTQTLNKGDVLNSEELLPGFELSVSAWFAEAEEL